MYVLRFLSTVWCFSVASQVHVQAIGGLPDFCKDTPENIGKMVDILVQILGSEEFVERDAVHKALISSLRQDVKG
ncbi:apoptosis inhibitor 5 homolog isoform X2 [Vigna radiata var. radiata]|nr:apoptosis inhibitor 5 homolog isoform X2 [Vigna radiata var. radiata]